MPVTAAVPSRLARLVPAAVERLGLDLSGLVVYTEAGTGAFAATAPLAAVGGAEHVFALASTWGGRDARAVGRETAALAAELGVASRVEVVEQRELAHLARADVVTNLGFVRPIDREVVMALKPTAAVPYMREAWEVRPGEVDLAACRERGIGVFATDEHHPDVRVFDACGLLAARLLFEAGIEILGSPVVVLSGDRFGPTIARCLSRLGADVRLLEPAAAAGADALVAGADALVVADFRTPGWIVGPDGLLEPSRLARQAPDLAVVAVAGGVHGTAVRAAGLRCVPEEGSRAGRMGRTLAHLGPRPVIDLHAAGLKVGAVTARAARQGLRGAALADYVRRHAPAMEMPEP